MAGSQQYKIKLSSYDTTLLENTVRKIIEASKKLGAKINGPIPLPTRKEVWSILRDPFVKKEHQEQFERRTHKRLIVVESNEELLNELKKISIPSGVAVAIK